MASRVKGIVVEIGGDTTDLQKALQGVNSKIKNTQTQLKDVERLLKLDPKNTELLAQKQKLLASAVSDTKDKLNTLKAAAKQADEAMKSGNSKITQEQYDALQDYKDPKNITPVFDFGYGMGSRMYGDGEYTYETRGVMNNLTSALLNGDKDSWAVLRDEWKSVIDEVIDGYNNQ